MVRHPEAADAHANTVLDVGGPPRDTVKLPPHLTPPHTWCDVDNERPTIRRRVVRRELRPAPIHAACYAAVALISFFASSLLFGVAAVIARVLI
jgi:hypothetical protein